MEGESQMFRRGSTPESILQKVQQQGLEPFDILARQVSEERVQDLMKDQQMMQSLLAASWPTDEKTCDTIAKKYGLGAEYIAAISQYQREQRGEKKAPRTIN